MNPLGFWFQGMTLAMEATRLGAAATTVIAHRLMGRAFIDPLEAARMWAEKPPAWLAAQRAFLGAARRGADPWTAALKPLRGPAERNARRLRR